MGRTLLATLTAIALFMGACERTTGDAEVEQRIAGEQQAITAYSDKVPDVDALQGHFVVEWRKANEIKELKSFKDAVEAQVVPALQTYLAALKVLPTGSPRLAEIHGLVVEAYDDAVRAFRTFVEGLTNDNVEARYKRLLDTMDAVAKAETDYRKKLGDYYAENRVKLVIGGSE